MESTLTCPKKEVKFVWEDNYSGDERREDEALLFGCINLSCCDVINADMKFIFTGTLVASAVMSIVIILTCVSAYKFQATAKELGRSFLTYDDVIKGGHAIVLGVIILCLLIICVINSSLKKDHIPQIPNFLIVDPLPQNADLEALGQFEKHLTADFIKGTFPLTSYKVVENKSSCGKFCNDFVYHVTVEVRDKRDKLILDQETLQNRDILIDRELLKDNPGEIIKFKGWFKDVNKVLGAIRYKPFNPLLRSKIGLDIKIRQEENFREELDTHWGGDRRLRRLDNDFYTGENPLFQMFQKEITFELFSSENKINYVGRLIQISTNASEDAIPVVDATIEATSPELDNNLVYQGKTGENGKFSMLIPLFILAGVERSKIVPYSMKILITKPGYLPVKITEHVGTYGEIKDFDIGTLATIAKVESNETMYLSGNITGSISKKEIGGAIVSIENSINYTNISTTAGAYMIEGMNICSGTLSVKKEGFYEFVDETICQSEDANITYNVALTPYINGYRMRATLSWKTESQDLDFKVRFFKNKKIECMIDHSQDRCGGAFYHGNAVKGEGLKTIAEVIDLEEIGPYQYIFFVEDDTSDKGEDFVRSGAHVELYSGNYNVAVATMDVPQYDRPAPGEETKEQTPGPKK